MRLRRQDGVLEVVGMTIPSATEIKPGMGILVNKERILRTDEANAVILKHRALPGVPASGRNRMRRGSDGQEVGQHQLAVVIPIGVEKTGLRLPAQAEDVVTVQHPPPIHSLIDLASELSNFWMRKMLTASHHPTQQQSRVDGREFAFPFACAGPDIDEMEIKPVLLRKLLPEETERGQDALLDFLRRPVASPIRYAKSGQTETDRSDAGNFPWVRPIRPRAILDEPGCGIGCFPEKQRRGPLQII